LNQFDLTLEAAISSEMKCKHLINSVSSNRQGTTYRSCSHTNGKFAPIRVAEKFASSWMCSSHILWYSPCVPL